MPEVVPQSEPEPPRAAESSRSRRGTVATFYSYKGGVGRSMALANVAALLARWGHRVLIVDWDLEAPGIEQYFRNKPSTVKGRRADCVGVLDLLIAFSAGEPIAWDSGLLEARPFSEAPPVSILAAGRDSADYEKNLQALDWNQLFASNVAEYLEGLRREWQHEFDYVLIDSRTGINDIGGICTVLLPDVLFLLFTSNEQSLRGIKLVAERAAKAQDGLPYDRNRLIAIPVPSRDESRSEYDTAMEWRKRFASELGSLYQDWLPEETTPDRALSKLYIPYWAKWSFGERLPVVEAPEELEDPGKIGAAYARLATLLASDLDWSVVEGEGYTARAEARQELAARSARLKRLAWRAAAVVLPLALALAFWLWRLDRSRRFDSALADVAGGTPEVALAALADLSEEQLDLEQQSRLIRALETERLARILEQGSELVGETDRESVVVGAVRSASAVLRTEMQAPTPAWTNLGATFWALDRFGGASARAERDQLTALVKAALGPPPEVPAEDWICLPGGLFLMGSEDGNLDERPVHPVALPEFAMLRYEVTNALLASLDSDSQQQQVRGSGPGGESGGSTDSLPAVDMDWYQAYVFAAWLGGRLPTEAEWEYAARGRGGRTYPWGDRPRLPDCKHANTEECGEGRIPVCRLLLGSTPEGICDLAGNVFEWTADWYGEYGPERVEGPWGRGTATSGGRVIRGGSFSTLAGFARTASRGGDEPGARFGNVGLRVVLSAPCRDSGVDPGS